MTIHHRPQPSSLTDPAVVRDWFLRGLVFSLLLGGALGGTAAFLHYLGSRPEPLPVGQVRIPVDELPKPGDPPLYRAECRCFLVHLRAGEGTEGEPYSLRTTTTGVQYRLPQAIPAARGGIIALSTGAKGRTG